MSRVEDQRKSQAETERMQKQADRASRDAQRADKSTQRFGQLMERAKTPNQAHEKKLGQQLGEQQATQQNRASSDAARMARMARGGTLQHGRILEQVKSFQGTLQNQKAQSAEAQEVRVQQRDEGMTETRVQSDERVSDLDDKRETRAELDREQAKAEAQAEGRANAAISGRGAGGGGTSQQQHEGQGDNAAALQKAQGAAGADEAASARAVQEIPELILQALADKVYVGVNAEGLAEFRIELKDGILEGATLQVTAEDGGIKLHFHGLEGNAKRLVQASEGDLGRRLAAKGLRLQSLSV